jgi:hypothetical protein
VSLKALRLDKVEMDENHFRVLGAYSRPGLEIEPKRCRITGAAAAVLAEVLGSNQGPTKLDDCYIDYSVLSDGLRGNSRLKSLRLRISSCLQDDNRHVLVIAGALREKKGLVEFNLSWSQRLSDETWGTIWDSLKTHATLEILNLTSTNDDYTTVLAVITSRIRALLNMMKMNMVIHTIHLNLSYREHELFRHFVIPYLVTNRSQPRVRAIQRTRPIP